MAHDNSERTRTADRNCISEAQRPHLERYGTWQRFHRGIRRRGLPLLKSLPNYRNCVLVAGCQRSGTTMLTRLIAAAPGFTRLALTDDDELDAALALAGLIDLSPERRYCFQTTYLNECYGEYRTLAQGQRLIWVLRNPYSVVYSMLYNWRRFALNELYEGCGLGDTTAPRLRRTDLLWPLGPSRLEKACLAYRGKVGQIRAIRTMLRPEQLLTIDYDLLIASPEVWLPRIFEFAGAEYQAGYAQLVRREPAHKAQRMSVRARRMVDQLALPTYRECISMAAGHGAG
jgi:Sulfotransferase domain